MANTTTNLKYYYQVVKDKPFGWQYTQPIRSSYYTFEEVDHFFWPNFIEAKRHYALYAAVVYIVTIYALQKWMKSRPAFELKLPLFLWNFSLGVFSILGLWRMYPGFHYILFEKENGFYTSICVKKELDVQTTAWVLFFAISKYVELGDTIFIILRKRPLVVLQWYHHVVTMSVVWILAPLLEPISRWYSVMNYGVHSLMYPYFALKAVGVKIPTIIANVITTLQLAQMIIGFTVNMWSVGYQQMGYDCARYPISIQLFSVVYGSFLILFGKLFYDSVIKSGRRRRDVTEKDTQKSMKVD